LSGVRSWLSGAAAMPPHGHAVGSSYQTQYFAFPFV
jgi:hypothetical protein